MVLRLARRTHILLGHAPSSIAIEKPSLRYFGSGGGPRGARGQGWWINYRAGKGGRHLQGEYAHLDVDALKAWNDAVLSLGSSTAYMDVRVEDIGSSGRRSSLGGDAGGYAVPNIASGTNDEDATSVPIHRLKVELATTVLPLATQNFMKLLQDEPGVGYTGSTLHRVEKQVGLTGGLVWKTQDDGRPGNKAVGRCHPSLVMSASMTNMDVSKEKLVLSHIPGTITMLMPRVHEIDSRFLLCTRHAPHLDGQSVAIGQLSDESLQIVQEWEGSLITSQGAPTNVTLRIIQCGVLEEAVTPNADTVAAETAAKDGEEAKKMTEL